jgi:hypothetical protein
MNSLLKRLDAVLDSQFLGTAWFENRESKTNIHRKMNIFRSIQYKKQLNINDLIFVCRMFFGDAFDEYVEVCDSKHIVLRKIPKGVNISDMYIYPCEKQTAQILDIRPARLEFMPLKKTTRTVINLDSTQTMILELCKLLISLTDVKDALLNGITDPSGQKHSFRDEGNAWFEKTMSEIDLKEKLDQLCSIKDKDRLTLNDIIEVCTIFFGDAYADFVDNLEDELLMVHNIRSEGVVYNVYIYPYQKEDVRNKHDPYARPARMVLKSLGKRTTTHIDLYSTRGMILLLCENFVLDIDTKEYLLSGIKQRDKDESTTQRKQKEEEIEHTRRAERMETSKQQEIISTLTNDQNECFKTWLAQVKSLTLQDHTIQNSSKMIDQLLAVVKQKINEGT